MALKDRRPTIQAIGWARDMYRAKLLDLDPPYQRRSVWNKDFKQFFVDSILRNYPVPPIFANLDVTKDGTTIYHVIDGKQRLLSLLEFLNDEFPLSKTYSPEFGGKFFSEIDPSVQKAFYSYFLPFEFFTEISDEQVVEIFDRFNRNVQRLNDQELRHARYGGAFITSMEQLADDPFWHDLNLFTLSDIRRMKDVEYASIIFVLTMHGIQDGDPLDSFYAEYDEAIPEVGKHTERYNVVKSMILEMAELVRKTRFGNRADFYSLWSAMLDFADNPKRIDYAATNDALREFADRVTLVPTLSDPRSAGEDAAAYSQAVRAGTTKGQNRATRKEILLSKIRVTNGSR